jgi:hypothetical protein
MFQKTGRHILLYLSTLPINSSIRLYALMLKYLSRYDHDKFEHENQDLPLLISDEMQIHLSKRNGMLRIMGKHRVYAVSLNATAQYFLNQYFAILPLTQIFIEG